MRVGTVALSSGLAESPRTLPRQVSVLIDPEPPQTLDGVEIVHMQHGVFVRVDEWADGGDGRLVAQTRRLWIVPSIPPQSFTPAREQEP